MNVPAKFKRLGDFHEYYNGTRKATIPTIFIGGNHECSSYLEELKFGGWVAPNIYYLGEFGSIWFKGLQIGGISGIFNQYSFCKNHVDDEILPFNDSSIRSVYHVKPKTFLKMFAMNHNLDIGLSHDWPLNIEKHGNVHKLLKKKHFFKTDIRKGTLGSPLNKFLLQHLRPRYWFSSHLHVKFEATVKYNTSSKKNVKRNDNRTMANMKPVNKNHESIDLDMDSSPEIKKSDEIELDMDDMEPVMKKTKIDWESTLFEDKSNSKLAPSRITTDNDSTYFLALDKCLPKRRFLEVIDIPVKPENTNHCSFKDQSTKFYYSRRAIAINHVVEKYLQSHKHEFKDINMMNVIEEPRQLRIVNELLPMINLQLQQLKNMDDKIFAVPENFEIVAPTSDATDVELQYWPNSQTEEYCRKFSIINSTPKMKPNNPTESNVEEESGK
jgi:lariat debranching enzyme